MSCAKSVLPVFMPKPSPQDRRREPPAIQIRPSNEPSESLKHQWIPWKSGSANRTVVWRTIESRQAQLVPEPFRKRYTDVFGGARFELTCFKAMSGVES